MSRRPEFGLALIVVVGVLGVLSVLAVAFVTMAQLERKASQQRAHAARAYLLAKSGIEDAMARLGMGQDPEASVNRYLGEDWNGDGVLNAGPETTGQVYQPGVLNVADCPVRHAMHPSFSRLVGGNPGLVLVDGRQRGYSGKLSDDAVLNGDQYALKVVDLNARIHINGGALDAGDRDPDGPGVAGAVPGSAAAEVEPLTPNGIPDYRDASMEGPNGFLVRLLNNLDDVVTGGATSNLGVQVVQARPLGGYKDVSDLQPLLGQARYAQFKDYLTTTAWVDASVVKPQPMDGRPQRWQSVDDAHRIGSPAVEIAGVHADPTTTTFPGGFWAWDAVTGVVNTLSPALSGLGTEASPWSQTVQTTNTGEATRPPPPPAYPNPPAPYVVRWERNFVYAWSQLRPAPGLGEPRAPVAINAAPKEVLASVFLGLKGTYLDVWDGSPGWEGGFGWTLSNAACKYPYPAQQSDEAPWTRACVDQGMTYGGSAFAPAGRPWYGPADFNPHATPSGGGGKPIVVNTPLGRLKETAPLTRDQALAIAAQIGARIAVKPFGAWADFNDFVDHLPLWEDINDDGTLDGVPYTVDSYVPLQGIPQNWTRRVYRREDQNSDHVMSRQVFTVFSGSWSGGNIVWKDPGLARSALAPSQVPGLTFLQKDLIKAMANPNTDLNCFNPDRNLFKEIDKTGICGIGTQSLTPGVWQADPASYVHTTELSLQDMGVHSVQSLGRVLGRNGRLLAAAQLRAMAVSWEIHRDTTQADFMRDYTSGARTLGQVITPTYTPPATPAPYDFTGDPATNLRQALVSYPEPQTRAGIRAADAAYDGQIGLGFIAARTGPDETLHGDLFDTRDGTAGNHLAVDDLSGPFQAPLLSTALSGTGNVFPDGAYSEKDRALKFPFMGNITDLSKAGTVVPPDTAESTFLLAFWTKPNWLPEASPRAHALVDLSYGSSVQTFSGDSITNDPYGAPGPVGDIRTHPVGLYFIPGRNNNSQSLMNSPYGHYGTYTDGWSWPSRSMIWGTCHCFYASDTLNLRGILNASDSWDSAPTFPFATKPVGRLEGHRWVHIGLIAQESVNIGGHGAIPGTSLYIDGKLASSGGGGGYNVSFGSPVWQTHVDLTPNHIRFGSIASQSDMNYVADATFAGVQVGDLAWDTTASSNLNPQTAFQNYLAVPPSPAVVGRYYKEDGASYVSSKLPPGIRPLSATWTEIPCDLWFDKDGNGWLDTLDNDQGTPGRRHIIKPNGLRDVRIDLELWDDNGQLAHFDDPAAANAVPPPTGRLYYKAVFVNEWPQIIHDNNPLNVTPYLDDVTIAYMTPSDPRILNWGPDTE